jgi:hypothetical protein
LNNGRCKGRSGARDEYQVFRCVQDGHF